MAEQRLIDAEKLIEAMQSTKEIGMGMFLFGKDQINIVEVVADAMMDDVKDALTVDAKPVVHGHWIEDKLGESYCSNCVSYAYTEYDYCPHCGATMDEPKEGYSDGND